MLLAQYQSAFGPVAGARHQRLVWGKLLLGVSFVQLEHVDSTRTEATGSSLELPKWRPKDPNSESLWPAQ